MNLFWRVWWLGLAVKLGLSAALPLSNDEAYYWVWGQHLQWSYFDHPPGIAVLFWLGQIFEGLRAWSLDGAVRWPTVLLGHSTFLIMRRLLAPYISEKSQVQWLIVASLSPFFGLGSLIATPDVGLVFFWTLGLLAFQLHCKRPTLPTSIGLGTVLGLGFCAKYHMALFVPIGLCFLLAGRRFDLFRPRYIFPIFLSGLLFSAPVWGWNATHEWASFRFQLNHGLQNGDRSLAQSFSQLGEYVGAQIGLLSPMVFFTFRRRSESRDLSILRWFGWGPILFFAYASTRAQGEANWPIAGHLSLLVCATLNDLRGHWRRLMMAIWVIASLLVTAQALRPDKPLFGVPAKSLKTFEFIRYNPLISIAADDSSGTPLFASSYQMAGALSFATKQSIPKLMGLNRKDFFDFVDFSKPSGSAFRIALETQDPLPDWVAAEGYRLDQTTQVDSFRVQTYRRAP